MADLETTEKKVAASEPEPQASSPIIEQAQPEETKDQTEPSNTSDDKAFGQT